MNYLQDIALAISLLQTILAALGQKGAPADVIDSVQASIAKLMEVSGSDATFEQLESLRTKPTW